MPNRILLKCWPSRKKNLKLSLWADKDKDRTVVNCELWKLTDSFCRTVYVIMYRLSITSPDVSFLHDTYALWITWWFTLSFGCPHTVLGRFSWPHHPTITYHLSIKSSDVSFFHAISGLVDYIFLTLYVGGWVGGLLMAGTPEGLLSLASYTVTFEWLPSVMKISNPGNIWHICIVNHMVIHSFFWLPTYGLGSI